MTKRIYSQTAFNAGELSPLLYSRINVSKYDNSLKTGTNCYVTPHGPVVRRNGTAYIAEVKTSSAAVRLLRYQLNKDTAFVLEFGNQYIRFFTPDGQVTSGGSPYEISSPYTTAQLDDIVYVQEGFDLYIVHPEHAPRKLTRNGPADWTLAEHLMLPPPTYESGHQPATTLTPAAATGSGINFTAGSSVFLAGDIGRQLVNLAGVGRAVITSVTSGTVVVCDVVQDFPDTSAIASGDWEIDLSPSADLTPNGTKLGSIITITAEDVSTSSSAQDTFRTDDVGRYIKIHGGVVQITKRNSASSVNGEVLKALTAKTETSNWTLETETWTSTRGYPRAVGVVQERLVFGGTDAQPQTIWMSETGLFDVFGGGSLDSDSVSLTMSASVASQISWISSSRKMVIGTSGSEHIVDGGSQSASITPSSRRQEPQSYIGSAPQVPLIIGNEIIFIQNSQRKIRSFRYSFESDAYVPEDLVFLAEHITDGLVKELSYAQEPYSQIYAVLEDGDMIVGTYVREQEVIGWTKYTVDGDVESVQVITNGNTDAVFVSVKRTIDGSTKRYIEKFDTGTGSDRLDGFSDSYLTYSEPKTITGITQADPGVVTATSHGFADGDKIKLIDVGGMVEVENTTYIVANKTTHTFELTDTFGNNVDTSAFTAYTSGGEAHELVTTLSGLDHLEGKVVQVKADGATHPDRTVASGAITLQRDTYEATVGLSYTTTIEPVSINFDVGMGPMRGQQVRHASFSLEVHNSILPIINDITLPVRTPHDKMDNFVGLQSGLFDYGTLGWDTDFIVSIATSDPLPLVLLGIFSAAEGGVL